MKDIVPALRSLGLLESEIKTYLAALESGASTVVDLARATAISRQATYLAIESLASRGLMTSITHGKKRLYSAEPPARIAAYARRRLTELGEQLKDLERAIPELELRAGGERPTVKVYKGKEGILAIIEEMRRSRPSHTEEIADLEAMYRILSPKDLLPMREEMKRINTQVRGLYAGRTSPKIVRSKRFALPEKYSGFKSNITIYGDKVALVTFEGKMYSVIIESKPLTHALGILFSLAYENSEGKFPTV
jgi:predicted transcriptional regulator